MGDAIFARVWRCGQNLRKILNHIRKLFAFLLAMIIKAIGASALIRTGNTRSYSSAAA
jgi:hypothetical protein